MWMVRAGRGAEHVEDFLQKSVVALGWSQIGRLPTMPSKSDLVALLAGAYPDEKDGTHGTWAATLLRFVQEISIGDEVLTYDREKRRYVVGKIASNYEWKPDLIDDMPNVRQVKWTHQVARDGLSTGARNTLGAIQTLFKVSEDVSAELVSLQVPIDAQLPEVPTRIATSAIPSDTGTANDQSSEAELRAEVLEKADEFVEDAISRLDGLKCRSWSPASCARWDTAPL